MSSSTSINTTSTSTSQGAYFFHNLTTLGLGYAIAIALGFLVLLSALLLASYVFCRYRSSHRRNNNNSSFQNPNPNPNPNTNPNAVILPRIIFVAEDDDDDGGPVPGLDEAAINSYPKFPYSKGSTNDTVCSICLCEYREGEMLRMLPDCRHSFHLSCVDAWLRLNASCPVCRTSPLPTPMSTPLSELVPLSQFNADRRRR
ncbi:RING-H2 finger protein ATL67 [Acorus calamus]|uniref:RING-H2 finger protein ATL67 n=1 Tax=Acorus calamus TaxID=4465 RepID=A0AAV9F9L3_ACOCL|nr:RING-H2 finger protein ATL67 [Acorus calamus]